MAHLMLYLEPEYMRLEATYRIQGGGLIFRCSGVADQVYMVPGILIGQLYGDDGAMFARPTPVKLWEDPGWIEKGSPVLVEVKIKVPIIYSDANKFSPMPLSAGPLGLSAGPLGLPRSTATKQGPHSRACGWRRHDHGSA